MSGDVETWRCDARWATVWPTGRHGITPPQADGPTAGAQHGGAAVSAAVAAHAIAVYSRLGDTVCDPDCGPGTVVAEAVHARRHAIGITTDDRWEAARTALTLAKARGARGDGMILDRLPDSESWTGLGPVDLVLTAIAPPDPFEPAGPTSDWLRERLAVYRELPRPGGHLVLIAAYCVEGGVDLASQITAAGRDVGLRPVQRAVALTAVPYLRELGLHRPTRPARAYPVHQDVIVFRAEGRQARHLHPPDRPSPAPHTAPSAPHRPAV